MTVFACAAWGAAAGSPARGQEPPVAGMKTIQLPLLLDLPGDLAFVRYTPGSLDRSASVQMRFELMAKEFQRSGFLQATLVFYVLSRDDWKEAGLPDPYGAPLVLGNDAIAMAGWADEQVVNGWRTLLGGELPMLLGQPMLMTPDEAASLAASDLVTQVEAARMLIRRTGVEFDAPWMKELFAHLVARLCWDKFEPGRMPDVAAVFDRLAANDRTPGGHRLADWRDGLPFETRAWYHARFLRAPDALLAKMGQGRLWKFIGDTLTRKKPLTEAALLKKYPLLVEWKATNFAP